MGTVTWCVRLHCGLSLLWSQRSIADPFTPGPPQFELPPNRPMKLTVACGARG
jgi:hypothetical protein